jgi:hypothetical protein
MYIAINKTYTTLVFSRLFINTYTYLIIKNQQPNKKTTKKQNQNGEKVINKVEKNGEKWIKVDTISLFLPE